MRFLLVFNGRRKELLNVFTETSHKDAGTQMRGQKEESFTITLRTETRTGLTQGKSRLCMVILSGFELIHASDL